MYGLQNNVCIVPVIPLDVLSIGTFNNLSGFN